MGNFKKLQPVVICITCVHSPLALTSNVTRLNTKVSHPLCIFILLSPDSERKRRQGLEPKRELTVHFTVILKV